MSVRFSSVERRGALFGLSAAQTGGVVAASLIFLATMWRARSVPGVFFGLLLAAATASAGLWPIGGLTPAEWAVRAASAAWRRATGRHTWISDVPVIKVHAPRQFATVTMTSTVVRGDEMGVLVDQTGTRATYSAALTVAGTSFASASAEERNRRIEAWGALVASLGESLVARLQVVARVVPADPAALQDFFDHQGIAHGGPWAAGYQDLLDQVASANVDTEVSVAVVVDYRKRGVSAEVRRLGGGKTGRLALLSAEVERLWDQLAEADINVGRPLTPDQLAAQVRSTLDPFHEDDGEMWPSAIVDRWSKATVDGALHASYWVSGWPQRPVEGGVFMAPLLLRALKAGHVRTFSLVIEPVAPDVALRKVERARFAEEVETEGRRKAGFGITARRQDSVTRLAEREQELVEGHTDTRYLGVVTVSAADDDGLVAGCAEAQRAAHQCHLRLRHQYGWQAEMLGVALPLGRGFGRKRLTA